MLERDKERFSFLDLISGMAGSAVIFGGFLYVGGWSYLYQYYRSFGLELSDVDIPVYDALIYSLPVIFHNKLVTVLIFALVLIIGLVFNSKWMKAKLPVAVSLLFMVILVTVYGLSRYGAKLGNEKARSDMVLETSNLSTVAIQVSPESSEMNKDDVAAMNRKDDIEAMSRLDKLEFKLLAHKKGQYFILRPFKGPSIEGTNVELIVIPESRVLKLRVQRGVD